MSAEIVQLCEGCPAIDNQDAQRLIGELSLRGIKCSSPLKDGNPFAVLRVNQPLPIRISCGVEQAIKEDLLRRGIEPSDELVNQIGCGDFSILDQA